MKNIFPVICLCLILSCAKQTKLDMKISSYTGSIYVNTASVSKTDFPLKQGDIVETTADSSCDIIINEKNILRLKPNSRIVLKISDKESTIQLDKGWLAGITRKIFTTQGKFNVITPTVTAAIRGTSFCLKVENDTSTYFCTCNGTIELLGKGSSSAESITAAHHSGRRFSLDSKGSLIEDNSVGLLYHEDKGLEEMASVIKETIDWDKPDTH